MEEDLKILYLHTRDAYPGYLFHDWCVEVHEVYTEYAQSRENPKTLSQWINGQIIALT